MANRMKNLLFGRKFNSFTYLNITQFLGALNDNTFRLLIIFFLIDIQGIENSSIIAAETGALFVIPFLIFSATGGKLADRYSKRDIIICCKFLELVVMALAVVAFTYRSVPLSYTALFLMSLQSVLFSPSKYGIVPELVRPEKLSKANGILTTSTILAIISGTFIASFITDITGRNFVFAAYLCLFFSILGTATSFYIERTPAMGYKKKINPFFLSEVYKTLKIAYQKSHLFAALLSCAFFLFFGGFLQLNMLPYSIESLGLTDVQGGYLFMLISLGIGLGSLLAGKISGEHVELGIVPIGGLGLFIFCLLLYFYPSIGTVIPLVIALGICGGLYEVPIESFIQATSPEKYRGQMIATANFLAYFGVLCASALLYFNANVLGLEARQGFIIIAILALLMTIAITLSTLDYFLRFLAFAISRTFFRITVDNPSPDSGHSSFVLCCQRPSSIVDTMLLTSVQRPPLRFFIESSKYHHKILRTLCRFIRIILVPIDDSKEKREMMLKESELAIKQGYTICIFTKSHYPEKTLPASLEKFQILIENSSYEIVPLSVSKKPSPLSAKKLTSLFKEFPWHVTIEGHSDDSPTNKREI